MRAKSRLARWGTSLAVRLPEPIAEQWGVQEGSAIVMISQGDQVVMRRKTCNLDDMLDQVTEENLHPGEDTGPARGNEAW